MTDTENEHYDVGWSEGYDEGYRVGYDTCDEDAAKAHIKELQEKEDEFERELESAVKLAIKDTTEELQDQHDSAMSSYQENMECMVSGLNAKIKQLMKENFELRKENAAITRSIQKST